MLSQKNGTLQEDLLFSSLLYSSALGSSRSALDSSRGALGSSLRGSNLLDGVVPVVRNSSAEYASTCGLMFAKSMVQFEGVGCAMNLYSRHCAGYRDHVRVELSCRLKTQHGQLKEVLLRTRRL